MQSLNKGLKGFGLLLVATLFILLAPGKAFAVDAPLQLSGASWFNGGGVGVCTSSTNTTCEGMSHVGGVSDNWWQCVELAQRFYKKQNWSSGIFPGVGIAADIYNKSAAGQLSGFSAQANGSVVSIAPGDMLVFAGGIGNTGHVGIVNTITDNNNGTKTLAVINQNTFQASSNATWNTAAKTVSKYSYMDGHSADTTFTVLGIVHAAANNSGGGSGGGETPNRVALLTPNSDIYAKDGLDSGGWVDQGTRAPTIAVGGSRLALINSDGSVFAKDTLNGGGWIDQGAAAKSIVVGFSGRMFIITPDNWVYAKDSLGSGGWINQDAQAVDVAVGQYRAAIINPCGAVYAKDNWGSGGWIQQSECNTAKDVAVSPTGRIAIITMDDHVFAKDNIAGVGGWLDQNATAVQLVVGGNRLMILTPDSHVYAKDHLGAGGWIDQGATAIAIAMTKRGRLVLLNSANRVFAKDDTNGGGWLDQDATASKIAA